MKISKVSLLSFVSLSTSCSGWVLSPGRTKAKHGLIQGRVIQGKPASMTAMNGYSDEFDGPDPQTTKNVHAVIGSGIASLSLTAALLFGSPAMAHASETTMPSVTNEKTCTIVEIVDANDKASESGTDIVAMNTDGGAASDCIENEEGDVQQAAVSVAENDKASAEFPEESASTDEANVLGKVTEESSEPESVVEEPVVEEEKLMAAASSEESEPEVVHVSADSEQMGEDSVQTPDLSDTAEEREQEPQFVDAPAPAEESSEEISGEDTNMIASSDAVEAPTSTSEEVKDETRVEAKAQEEEETDEDTD